jgi:ribonuclease D
MKGATGVYVRHVLKQSHSQHSSTSRNWRVQTGLWASQSGLKQLCEWGSANDKAKISKRRLHFCQDISDTIGEYG